MNSFSFYLKGREKELELGHLDCASLLALSWIGHTDAGHASQHLHMGGRGLPLCAIPLTLQVAH